MVGKPLGIVGTTWLVARFTRAEPRRGAALARRARARRCWPGSGSPSRCSIGDLAFGGGGDTDDHVKVGILLGSLVAAVLAGILVKARDRVYRRIYEAENVDDDQDGIPDVYQR